MAKIIAICGKICCGKTYYANQIKEKENIYGKTLIGKWFSTLIGFPILAVIIAWVISKL